MNLNEFIAKLKSSYYEDINRIKWREIADLCTLSGAHFGKDVRTALQLAYLLVIYRYIQCVM